MNLVSKLRAHLVGVGIVRRPDVAGQGPRPWPAPAYVFPEDGPVAPGDAKDIDRSPEWWDDGLVLSIMWAPGIPPAAGEEERRVDGIDLVLRATSMPPLLALEAALRAELVGTDPGGHCDWVMDGNLYVIQSRQWRPFAPVDTADAIFTFSVGYTFETRAT
jgi:hypothetical protein